MRDLAARGVGMIHISHRLDEIPPHRGTASPSSATASGSTPKPTLGVTKQQIINMMVGRVIYSNPKRGATSPPTRRSCSG